MWDTKNIDYKNKCKIINVYKIFYSINVESVTSSDKAKLKFK